jgi:outer membrane protein assembly factor BamD (BamD/ComL family)
LFSEANLLRRQGNTARATSKYRQLQAQFARSTEAAVSHVILGRMLLQAGRAAEACSEFTSYGSRFPRGTLAAEALQGQITCARLTADRKLERRACEQLLMRFADSPYAAAAKDRCEGGR